MTVFLMVAALMTAAALAFILPALLGKQKDGGAQAPRDQVNLAVLRDQLRELDSDLAAGTIDANAHESARRELAQRVAEDVQQDQPASTIALGRPIQAIAVGLAIVIGAAALYAHLGTPAGLDPAQVTAANEKSHDMAAKDLDAAVERLVQQLKTEPQNAEGWLILARSLSAMGRFADASGAYKHLMTLSPDNPQLLAEYAGNLAMTQGQSLQGEPEKLLKRSLEIEPKNTKALALIGSAAFERGDYGAAITWWEKILTLAPADSQIARVAADNIKDARAAAAENPSVPADATSSSATRATQVAGTVELDPSLRSEVSDTDTVFIFAKAAEGPRFPLAVLRKQVKDLPASFVLDDSMSMMPDARLSGFPLLVVGARISKTGSATPGAGDLEGSITSVQPGARNLKIRINSRRN